MSFHEIRFPANLSFGSVGGPERRTDIVTLANGYEERNTPWEHARRRYDAGVGLRSMDDIDRLIAFFEARRGALHAFRWKDWSDFKSSAPSKDVHFEDQLIAFGDGGTASFQLVKVYRSGEAEYRRPISKPVQGSVRIGVDGFELREGDGFAVDATTGIITIDDVPDTGARVTAGFEFDVPVRFDTEGLQTSISSFQSGEMPRVPVVEVRL